MRSYRLSFALSLPSHWDSSDSFWYEIYLLPWNKMYTHYCTACAFRREHAQRSIDYVQLNGDYGKIKYHKNLYGSIVNSFVSSTFLHTSRKRWAKCIENGLKNWTKIPSLQVRRTLFQTTYIVWHDLYRYAAREKKVRRPHVIV